MRSCLILLIVVTLDSMVGLASDVIDAEDPALEHVHGLWLRNGRPLSGVLVGHDDGGAVIMTATVANGLLEGVERRWFSTGEPESVRRFAGGRKVGLHQGWWPDGTPRFRATYHADAFDGRYEAWYRTGRLAERREYIAGREAGHQQMWMADGTLYVNYEVRAGRRFGMVNAKPCIPAGDM